VAGLAFALADAPARLLVTEDPPAIADAVVVLAGDPGYERTATAARLVLAGQARLLVLTGGEPGPGDSAASLRDRAVALGVPLDRIRLEATSHSTREAMLAVAPLLRAEGARSVIVVTSPYHQRRAAAAARRARGVAAPGLVERRREPPRRNRRVRQARLLLGPRLDLDERARAAAPCVTTYQVGLEVSNSNRPCSLPFWFDDDAPGR
jgi:uncharacterized SAM-binding protein YcdF (DUF218 family)